jgi:hypothetical protein
LNKVWFMEPRDFIRRVAPADLACSRCTKSMAIGRLYYAVDTVTSVGYKCLYCGHEESHAVVGDIIKTD